MCTIHTVAIQYNSRMTIAHLIETLLGKQGLQTGHEGDATPFIECTVAEISKNLHQVLLELLLCTITIQALYTVQLTRSYCACL
jgi:RNA polymerase Rpb2, domain 6